MTDARMSLLGVNLSGAEFGSGTKYGWNYIYPTHSEIDYYASKNLNVIRLPFKWERLQPTLNGSLDPAELARIDDIVTYAAQKGIKVILDPHDFGGYNGKLIGSADVPNSAFADFWGKLAAHFKSNGNVMFGLMNEPNQQSATDWLQSENAAIAAIRNAGATQELLVQGSYWDGGSTWTTSDNASVIGTGIKDPLKNFAFEVHQYLDQWSSGTQTTVVSPTIGVERLTAITQWAEATGNRLFLGEFGVSQDPTSLTAMANMLTYMDQHTKAWQGATYWGAGPWWGSYPFSIEPSGGVDKPQMQVLEAFAPIPASSTAKAPSQAAAPQTLVGINRVTGDAVLWAMDRTARANRHIGNLGGSDWSVAATGDLDQNGSADIVWNNTRTGQVAFSLMNGLAVGSTQTLDSILPVGMAVEGVGDLDHNGNADIVMQDAGGIAYAALMNGSGVTSLSRLGSPDGTGWTVAGVGDITGDGHADIIWDNLATGQALAWDLSGSTTDATAIGQAMGSAWAIKGVGDVDGNGTADLVWENRKGQAQVWAMNGTSVSAAALVGTPQGTRMDIKSVADLNGDGKADILWEDKAGQASAWFMNGTTVLSSAALGQAHGSHWNLIAGL